MKFWRQYKSCKPEAKAYCPAACGMLWELLLLLSWNKHTIYIWHCMSWTTSWYLKTLCVLNVFCCISSISIIQKQMYYFNTTGLNDLVLWCSLWVKRKFLMWRLCTSVCNRVWALKQLDRFLKIRHNEIFSKSCQTFLIVRHTDPY